MKNAIILFNINNFYAIIFLRKYYIHIKIFSILRIIGNATSLVGKTDFDPHCKGIIPLTPLSCLHNKNAVHLLLFQQEWEF